VKRQFKSPPPHPSGAVAPVIDSALVPKHVAIVMDGNGRWAKERGLARTAGHEAGEASRLASLTFRRTPFPPRTGSDHLMRSDS
jgi:hypothetical protein